MVSIKTYKGGFEEIVEKITDSIDLIVGDGVGTNMSPYLERGGWRRALEEARSLTGLDVSREYYLVFNDSYHGLACIRPLLKAIGVNVNLVNLPISHDFKKIILSHEFEHVRSKFYFIRVIFPFLRKLIERRTNKRVYDKLESEMGDEGAKKLMRGYVEELVKVLRHLKSVDPLKYQRRNIPLRTTESYINQFLPFLEE